MNKRNILIIVGGLIAVLLVVVFVLLSGEDGLTDRDDRIDGRTSDPTQHYELGEEGAIDLAETFVTYETVLDDYRRWAQYPPDSRPLRPSFVDQIEHHWVPLPPQNMPTVNEAGELVEPKYSCRIQPQKHTVTEGEQIEVTLRCAGVGEGSEPVKIDIREVVLKRVLDTQSWQTETPQIEAGTAENRFQYKLTYRPRKDDWGDMFMEVNFVIPAEPGGFTHTLKTHFFSSPVAPAQFEGIAGERIEDGSLIITANLNVKLPGRYTIEANLFNEDGPVAYAREDARLQGGPQQVELKYFGKIFHDANAVGPYILRGLRGIQNTDPIDPINLTKSPEEVDKYLKSVKSTTPHRRTIPTWEKEYKTQDYQLSEFSNSEWDSPEKRERIAELSKLAGQ